MRGGHGSGGGHGTPLAHPARPEQVAGFCLPGDITRFKTRVHDGQGHNLLRVANQREAIQVFDAGVEPHIRAIQKQRRVGRSGSHRPILRGCDG